MEVAAKLAMVLVPLVVQMELIVILEKIHYV